MLAIPQSRLEDWQRRAFLALRTGSRKVLGLVLLGIAVVLGVWGMGAVSRPPEGISEQRAALIRALGPVRLTEGRLVGFGYAPPGNLPPASEWRTPEVARAIRMIQREADLRPSGQALADRAVVSLLNEKIPDAVADLERGQARTPEDPRLLNDLSAAYLASPETGQSFQALALAERAIRLGGNLPSALFNRAIALEKLALFNEAVPAWKKYLEVDRRSEWAEEAQKHVKALMQPRYWDHWLLERQNLLYAAQVGDEHRLRKIVAEFPQGAREYSEGELLGQWAESGPKAAEGAKILQALQRLGAVLAELTGDFMLEATVQAIDRNLRPGHEEDLRALTEGHRLYWMALIAQEQFKLNEACAQFPSAEAALVRGGSPMAAWAHFYVALCEYNNAQFGPASESLDRLEESLLKSGSHYPVLQGRIFWLRGLIAGLRGHLGQALSGYGAALGKFEQSRQHDFRGVVLRLTAEAYDYLGEDRLAWRHLQEALRISPYVLGPKWRLAIFETGSQIAQRQSTPQIALYFENEGLRAAERSANGLLITGSLALRAEVLHAMGDDRGALADVAEARRRASRLDMRDVRASVEADATRIEGQVVVSSDPARGTELLGKALESYWRDDYHRYIASIHLDRALGFRRLGREDEAESDLLAGLRELESQRAGLDAQLKTSLFDRSNRLFEEMLSLKARRDDPAEAFAVAESSRARTLADRLGNGEDPGAHSLATLSDVTAAMPEGVVLLEYAVLSDRLLIWAVRHDRQAFVEVPVSQEALGRAVSLMSASLGQDDSTARKTSRRLYSWLIKPVEEMAAGQESIVFVPHRMLHEVPFAALVSPETGRYLVEDHACMYVPSATIYLKALSRERVLPAAGLMRPLVIANPALDRSLDAGLPDLPMAAKEGSVVASLFPGTDVAAGGNATKERLLGAGEYDLLHVAAHAIPNPEFPLLSRIVLAPSPGDPDGGVLFAHEIYRTKFDRTRLVVLAACNTAVGRESASEGIQSLVRPFLASGVPSVVGASRRIEDGESLEVFREFYRRLAGLPSKPGRVLQETQIYFASHSKGRGTLGLWAFFQCIGSCGSGS